METTCEKKVTVPQLTNTEACEKWREFSFRQYLNSGEKKDYMLRSSLIIKTAKELSRKLYEIEKNSSTLTEEESTSLKTTVLEETRSELLESFSELGYRSKDQERTLAEDAYAYVTRYAVSYSKQLHSEGLVTCEPKDVQIPNGPIVQTVHLDGIDVLKAPLDEEANPLAEFMFDGFKLKAGKPVYSQKKYYESLELYAILLYLRSKVRPGHTAYLRASIQYLRKDNDRFGDKYHFDSDFYDTSGGLNIVSAEEVYYAPRDGEPVVDTDNDVVFAPTVKRYVEGIKEEECSQKDCEKCDLHDICKHSPAPLALTKAPAIRSMSSLKLTDSQNKIINFRKGNLRVISGPGSGKTMVVSVRTVSLLLDGAAPESIFLISFTDAAAREMKERVSSYYEDMTGEKLEGLQAMTFNSFGDYMIGLKYEELGFSRKPSVIDDVERSKIILELLVSQKQIEGLDYRNLEMNTSNCKGALAIISKIFEIVKKGENGVSYGVTDLQKIYDELGADRRFIKASSITERSEIIKKIVLMYDLYDEKLREENLIEYADQETLPFEIMRMDPMFISSLGIRHLIVDEYQDSNSNNSMLCKAIVHAKGVESTMFVGDISQSIYAFRGGLPENLSALEAKLDCDITDIPLMENFRSDKNVCEFANMVISKNTNGAMYKIKATKPANYPVQVKGFHFTEDEQVFAMDVVKKHLSGELLPKVRPEEIAILCATKGELQKMAGLLASEGIETVMLAPEPLKENSRVRAALALFKALSDPNDTKDLLIYANARLYGGLIDTDTETGEEFLVEIREELDAARKLKGEEKKEMIIDLLRAIDENEDEVYESFVERVTRKRDYAQMALYADSFDEFGDRVSQHRLHDFSGVVLTTAHSSKGLEWPVIVNMIDKYDDSEETHTKFAVIEEKRRLLYVSSTRAKDRLYVLSLYKAFGRVGNYTYNRYLEESLEAIGQTFDRSAIEKEKRLLDIEKKKLKGEVKESNLNAAS